MIAFKGRLSGSMLGECKISTPRYFAAAVAGSVTYIVLYLAKSFVSALLAGSAPEAAGIALVTKLATSSVNAVLAVVISVPLAAIIKKALKSAKLTA